MSSINLSTSNDSETGRLASSLATSGLRFTRQRQQVFDVLAGSHDHPTAEDVFERARLQMPDISFATVYNCLSVLVQCGLVRQVILDKSPARFCPNMREHCHFYCEQCGCVTDIDSPVQVPTLSLPEGFKVLNYDFSMRGFCAGCSQASRQ